MAVPYTFGSATSAIPLSQLDSNFATTITLGNTAIQLGNTVTTLNNMTLANVTVTTVSGASANAVVYTNSSGQVTANSSVIALDTSGNLGLGVTPSAWVSTFKSIDVSTYASFYGRTSAVTAGIASNAYQNSSGNWTYKANNYAAKYDVDTGQHVWWNAASGTAGNTITFTQAMTLDASGNLGVGVTPATISLGKAIQIGTVGNGIWSAGSADIRLTSNVNYNSGYYYATTNTASLLQMPNDGTLQFANAPSGTAGTSISSFSTRLVVDASGNLLVGTTTDSGKVYSKNANNTDTLVAHSTSTTYQQTLLLLLAARNTTNTSFYAIAYYNLGASAYKFIVADSGNVTNANNSYGGISDIKLKENITDATPKLADLMKVKVRQYNFKSEPSNKQLGVVAQELEQVFPSMVDESPDKDAEGNDLGTTTKSVKYSVFVPMLIKAIQEQQAIIETLTSRIAALENK